MSDDGSKKRPDIEDELRLRDEVPDGEISDIILRAAQLEAESKIVPRTTTVDELIQMGRELEIKPDYIEAAIEERARLRAQAALEREAAAAAQAEADKLALRKRRERLKKLGLAGRWILLIGVSAGVLWLVVSLALSAVGHVVDFVGDLLESDEPAITRAEPPPVQIKSEPPTPPPTRLEPPKPPVERMVERTRPARSKKRVRKQRKPKRPAAAVNIAQPDPEPLEPAVEDEPLADQPEEVKKPVSRRPAPKGIRLDGEWVLDAHRVYSGENLLDVPVDASKINADRQRWSFRTGGRFSHRMDSRLGFSGRYVIEGAFEDMGLPDADGPLFILHAKGISSTIPGLDRKHDYFLGTMIGRDLVLHYIGRSLSKRRKRLQGARFKRQR